MRSKHEKFWEQNMGVALALTMRSQLSNDYDMHMRYSRIYLYCKERLEEANRANPTSQNRQ